MKRKQKRKLAGLFLAALGTLLLLEELGFLEADLLRFWPALLVAAGLYMLAS